MPPRFRNLAPLGHLGIRIWQSCRNYFWPFVAISLTPLLCRLNLWQFVAAIAVSYTGLTRVRENLRQERVEEEEKDDGRDSGSDGDCAAEERRGS